MDHRREWIKDRILKMTGLDADEYFEDLMSANDSELDDRLAAFLDDDIQPTDPIAERLFYVYRVPYEKLVEEEIMVAEIGKFSVSIYACFLITVCRPAITLSQRCPNLPHLHVLGGTNFWVV